MKEALQSYIDLVNRFNEWIGNTVSWLTLVLVLLIFCDVLLRYVFSISNVAVFELEWHLFSVIFLLSAGYTLKRDKHVRVDVFYQNFSVKKKAWVDLLGTLFFLMPFCVLVIASCIPYVRNSYILSESSTDPGGLPYRFVIKGMIAVGFGFLMIQGTSLAVSSLKVILWGEESFSKKA